MSDKNNKLFTLCNSNRSAEAKDRIGLKFQVAFPEKKIVRKQDVVTLYMDVINTVLPLDNWMYFFNEVQYALDKDKYNVELAERFKKFRLDMQNGTRIDK